MLELRPPYLAEERMSSDWTNCQVHTNLSLWGWLTRVLIPPVDGNLLAPPLSHLSTSAAAPRPSLSKCIGSSLNKKEKMEHTWFPRLSRIDRDDSHQQQKFLRHLSSISVDLHKCLTAACPWLARTLSGVCTFDRASCLMFRACNIWFCGPKKPRARKTSWAEKNFSESGTSSIFHRPPLSLVHSTRTVICVSMWTWKSLRHKPVLSPCNFPSSSTTKSLVEIQYSLGSMEDNEIIILDRKVIDLPLPKWAATSVWP